MPAELKRSLELWAGCIAGALREDEYRRKLAAAGFADIDIEVTREYALDDVRDTAAWEVVRGYLPEGQTTLAGFVSAW